MSPYAGLSESAGTGPDRRWSAIPGGRFVAPLALNRHILVTALGGAIVDGISAYRVASPPLGHP